MKQRNSMENSCFSLIFHFLPNQPMKETSISGVAYQLWTQKLYAPPCGGPWQVTMETGGPGIPFRWNFSSRCQHRGRSGWEKVIGWPHYHADHPVQLRRLFQFQHLSQSMHAWYAENAELSLSLDKEEEEIKKSAYILKQSDFKAITKSNNSLGKRVIVHCFAIFKVTRHHIVRTDGRVALRFYFNTLWSREMQEISD